MAASFGIEPEGCAFQNMRSIVQLQAARVLAWESFKAARDNQLSACEVPKSFQGVHNIDIKARFFHSFDLLRFVKDVTLQYEAQGWDGPLGGFLLP